MASKKFKHKYWKNYLERIGFKFIAKSCKGNSWYFSNDKMKIRVSDHFNTRSDADFSIQTISSVPPKEYKEELNSLIALYK